MDYLFIVAHGRSGSTALQKVLNALPGYVIRGESGGIMRNLALAAHTARQLPAQYPPDLTPDRPWYGAGAIAPAPFAADLTRAFTDHILRPPPGTRVTGCKEIRYLPKVERRIGNEPYEAEDGLDDAAFDTLIDLMLDGFGRGRVILLSRDPRETARSSWFQAFETDQVIARLTACAERFDTVASRDPERLFRIRHEEFARNPEGLRPLLDWLGEDIPEHTLASLLSDRLTHATEIPKRHRKQAKPRNRAQLSPNARQ